MTTKRTRNRKPLSIKSSRWAAYATAGAATAVGAAATTEAAIHYSGPINQSVNAGPSSYQLAYFNLDNSADHLGFLHSRSSGGYIGVAKFGIFSAALNSVAFVGFSSAGFPYVSKLGSGANINGAGFNAAANVGTLAFGYGYGNSQWLSAGTGFIGFRFNNGSGTQYGWVRVTMDGSPGNSFTVVDYAYGDVGQMINAGQIPEPGSLALLALGGLGLVAWRKRRSAQPVAA